MTPPCLELSGLPRTSWGKPIPAQRHLLKVPGAMLYFSATCFSFNKSDMQNLYNEDSIDLIVSILFIFDESL